MQHLQFLGLIPARGGSKGIAKKCITTILDKPLISYTIEEAKKSRFLQRIIVSTDDEDIASVSKEYGAEVPFMRPKELAQDDTPTLPVIQHALTVLRAQGYVPDYIVLLQPTSPLRDVSHINAAIEKMIHTRADMVVSLCKVTQHPFWMRRMDGDKVSPFIETKSTYHRRQDLPELYRPNGAITVARREVIETTHGRKPAADFQPSAFSLQPSAFSLPSPTLTVEGKKGRGKEGDHLAKGTSRALDIRGYVMEEAVSVDMDTPLDLFIAQKLLEARGCGWKM